MPRNMSVVRCTVATVLSFSTMKAEWLSGCARLTWRRAEQTWGSESRCTRTKADLSSVPGSFWLLSTCRLVSAEMRRRSAALRPPTVATHVAAANHLKVLAQAQAADPLRPLSQRHAWSAASPDSKWCEPSVLENNISKFMPRHADADCLAYESQEIALGNPCCWEYVDGGLQEIPADRSLAVF